MKRRNLLTGAAAMALLRPKSAAAVWAQFQDTSGSAPPPIIPPPPSGQIASIPLASFTQQNLATPGFAEANGAGGTADGTFGWNTQAVFMIRQTWFNFPQDDIYQFVVPCYVSQVTGVPGNSVAVYIDMFPIQTAPGIGNTTTNNWFCQFVQNVAPSQPFTFQGPVKAGFHSIRIDGNSAAYNSATGTAPNRAIHLDRLNIIATGVGLPTEPLPQTRDPAFFPHSSFHFINTPFGASAIFDAPSTPRSQTINGTGGNGAQIFWSTQNDGENVWRGDAASPVFTYRSLDDAQTHDPSASFVWPVRTPPGAYPAFGALTDSIQYIVDRTNPRYFYGGQGNQIGSNGRSFTGIGTAIDSYNLNHPMPQTLLAPFGLITLADINSGVIAHRMTGGLSFAATAGGTTGYSPATQTSDISGVVWPGFQSDANWAGVYTNPNGVPYASVLGIPPNVAKPGGLTTGGSMLWDCFQHYGLFLNRTGSNYPAIHMFAEGACNFSPIWAQMQAASSTIVPHLCVMANPQPLVINPANPQGFGGGNVVVPLLPGVQQGLASIGKGPYIIPASPVGIPIQVGKSNGIGSNTGGGALTGSAFTSIPIGSCVIVHGCLDRTSTSAISCSALVDSAGNNYTVFQPAASIQSVIQNFLAVCASTTATIPSGGQWKATLTPAGLANWNFLGAYYRPTPPSGSTSIRTSGTASSSPTVTTLSTSLVGVQTNDLVIGAVGVNNTIPDPTTGQFFMGNPCQDNYFTDPSGFTTMQNTPPTALSFQRALSSGTVNFNPSWRNAARAQVVAVAIANANIAT